MRGHKRVFRRAMPGNDGVRGLGSLLDVLLEEIRGALPGGLGACLVKAPTLVAMEAVRGAGIDVDLAVAAAFLLDDLHVAHRDRGVLVAEMHLCGHLRL